MLPQHLQACICIYFVQDKLSTSHSHLTLNIITPGKGTFLQHCLPTLQESHSPSDLLQPPVWTRLTNLTLDTRSLASLGLAGWLAGHGWLAGPGWLDNVLR